MSSILLFGNLVMWLTPVWILSVGVTIGMAILLVLYGLMWLVARRAAESVARVIRESVLLPITYMAVVLVGFCVLGAPAMPARETFDSLKRLTAVGPLERSVTIPAGQEDVAVPIFFNADELQRYSFESDQNVVINEKQGNAYAAPLILVQADEPFDWTPSSNRPRLLDGVVTNLYVTNQGTSPAELKINLLTDVVMPQVHQIPITAVCRRGGLRRLFPDLLVAARRVGDRLGHGKRGRRPTALHSGDAGRGVRAAVVHLHPLQHVRRRREDAQGLGPHHDHDPGDPRRPLDGERLGGRRNRGQDGGDAALQADQPAAVRDRQVPGHRLAAVLDVRHPGRDPADHRLVQSRLRRPRNRQPRAELAAMLRSHDRHRAGTGAGVHGNRRA